MNKNLGINTLKKIFLGFVASVLMIWQLNTSSAIALQLQASDRTISLDDTQETVLSDQQVSKGQRLFVSDCSKCHNTGRTKTNPNVSLSLPDLQGAEPRRDTLMGMVDYLKNPTSYDGEQDLSQLHPNTNRADLFASMRNYTEADLENVSGYILVQAKVRGIFWGGGKEVN